MIGMIRLLNARYSINKALTIDKMSTVGNYCTVRLSDSSEPVAIPVKQSS